MTEQEFNEIGAAFDTDPAAGMALLIRKLEDSSDHHSLFRAKVLAKRNELKLPLLNPGNLKGAPDDARKTYEECVETVCREIGQRYLKENNITQAWRYFRTISDEAPIREALEKAAPETASDELIEIAIGQGVHPLRGFEIILERDGLCRGVSTFDTEFSQNLDDKKAAAAMLVRAIYRDLVLNTRKQIYERFNEYPPETDLVDLFQHRPWMFENSNYHSDPSHLIAICRIGIIIETEPERIMALSCSEYGKKLDKRLQYEGRAPFENGYSDYAMYYRALLGQNVDETIAFFKEKLTRYDLHAMDSFATEAILLLLWNCGKQKEALEFWREHFQYTAPDQAGMISPSFYELCAKAGDFAQLAEVARNQSDTSAWAAAKLLGAKEVPKTTEAAKATEEVATTKD